MNTIIWASHPSPLELEDAANGVLQEEALLDVRAHLEGEGACEACRATVARGFPTTPAVSEAWAKAKLEKIKSSPHTTPTAHAERPETIRPGQVWTVKGRFEVGETRYVCRAPRPVVVMDGEGPLAGTFLLVVPLATEVAGAGRYDLLLEIGGVPEMAMCGIHTSGLSDQLDRYIGELDGAALEALNAVVRAADLGEELPEEIAARCGRKEAEPDDHWAWFRMDEADKTAHLSRPAFAIAGRDLYGGQNQGCPNPYGIVDNGGDVATECVQCPSGEQVISLKRTSVRDGEMPLWASDQGFVFSGTNPSDLQEVGGWLPEYGPWVGSWPSNLSPNEDPDGKLREESGIYRLLEAAVREVCG